MSGGEIYDNTSNGDGGGVYVYSSTFTMSSGKIFGNTSTKGQGGGVYAGSTFTMNGGDIYGNTSNGSGGGAFVYDFRLSNGAIYGSNAADDLKNTAVTGAALNIGSRSWYANTAQYGTFNGDTWISKGNLLTTNNTIRVINGVLQ